MPMTVWILMLVQALSMSVAPLLVFAGGIVGKDLAPTPELSTLPLAIMVVGTAISVVPAARLMHLWGRKRIFVCGTLLATIAALLAGYSLTQASFWLFCFAGLLMGSSLSIAQQYRFAAMEAVPPELAGKAASRVILGGLVAAYLGPELVVFGDWFSRLLEISTPVENQQVFAGAFVLLAGVTLVALLILLCCYRNQQIQETAHRTEGRPVSEILRNSLLWMAITAAAMGYAMMAFMMTATPLNMHTIDGHSLMDTKWVIQSHILAMFAPSFFTGWLIARFGFRSILGAGVAAYVICLLVAMSGHHLMHYWWALVLLGIGWNFLFVGGTALLPFCYQPNERFKIQPLNDFLVFGIQAIVSLSSGWVVVQFGWQSLLLLCTLMIAMIVVVMWWSRLQPIAQAK